MIAITRRRMLQLGFASTAMLTVGGGLAWVTLGYRLRDGETPIALSAKEFVVARAIVETLLPAADGVPAGVDLGVPQRIDEEIWAAPDALRSDLKAALHLIEHVPPLLGFAGRFSSLSAEAREACYGELLRSRHDVLVLAAGAFKQMAHLFAYVRPESWGAIGYDGPWVKEPKPPDSAVRYAALVAERRA